MVIIINEQPAWFSGPVLWYAKVNHVVSTIDIRHSNYCQLKPPEISELRLLIDEESAHVFSLKSESTLSRLTA